MGVNHTTVLRRIATLEQKLGVRLFQRSTTGQTLTAAGEEVARLARTVDDAVVSPIYDGDLDARGQPPAVESLRRSIRGVDGLVIAAPEYNHSVAPLLKNAIDWVSHPVQRSPFAGKSAALMSAASRPWGGTRMLPHLRDILVDLGVHVLPHMVAVPVAEQAFGADGALLQPATQAHLTLSMRRFAAELVLRSPASEGEEAA